MSTGPPPILKICDDILWNIFVLNTLDNWELIMKSSGHHEYSLITARHTSQVCTRWRTLILGSSSLWANTINLQHLDQINNSWRNEVLKRTGNSPLSVKGDLEEGRPTAEFFLALLAEHWTRFRRMCIRVQNKGIAEDERWHTMWRPAPNLEIISISFPACPESSIAYDVLFPNNLPSPHTLCMRGINFNLSGPWLSHVRQLDLFDCPVVNQNALHALAQMVSLEELDIIDMHILDIDAESGQWPWITLPKLSRLSLSANLQTLIALLGRIRPIRGFTEIESIYINSTVPNLSALEIYRLRQCLAAHFRNLSDFGRNKAISWSITDEKFSFHNIVSINKHLPPHFHFSFYSEIEDDAGWQHIACIILDSLHSCGLSVKTLEFKVFGAVFDPSNADLVKFYQVLTSVETMHVDSETIELLLKIQEHAHGDILCPRLQTIVFDTSSELKSDVIMQFLTQRLDAGKPFKTFDLSYCTSTGQECLLFLEEIDGLNVEWNEEIRSEMLDSTALLD